MTPATKLLIVISGALVLLLAAIFIVYPYFSAPTPASTDVTVPVQDPSALKALPPDTNTPASPIVDAAPAPVVPPTEAAQRAEAERLTRMFVERFGSYSNFSDFTNITSLQQFMTPSMQTYTLGLMKKQSETGVNQYVGITSQLISLVITKFQLGHSATVSFVVQQETQSGLNAPIQTSYKDGTLDLEYRDNQWLVDGIYYKK